MVNRYSFIGCPIDSYSFDGSVSEITTRITSKESTSLIHFLNVGKIVKAQKDDHLRRALWDGDLVLADGKPLLPFARGFNIILPTRVNGTDLMEKLMEVSEREGFSIYLFGAKHDVLEKCVENIKRRYQNLSIAGYRHGYFRRDEIDEIICSINESAPDILFLGLPTPLKELFSYENRDKFQVPIVQGAGGNFDVFAGRVKRAPRWMQNFGLEWLYRVQQEPRRMFWRYFATNIIFMMIYAKHFLLDIIVPRPAK